MPLDGRVAKAIILAQTASDGGKQLRKRYKLGQEEIIYSLFGRESTKAYKNGYKAKDAFVTAAIERIARNKNSGFRFFVTACNEKENARFLVYFDYYIEDKKFQISFHSRDDTLKKYLKGCKKSHTEWDKGNSRQNCIDLFYAIENRKE